MPFSSRDKKIELLLKRLALQIASLATSTLELVESVRKQHETTSRAKQPPPNVIVHPELGLPVAITETYRTNSEDHQKHEPTRRLLEKIKTAAEVLALLMILGTLIYTKRQWEEMRDQTAAMRQTLKETQDARRDSNVASQQDQRAWVGPVMATGHDGFNGGPPRVEVGRTPGAGIVLSNRGKTIALNVTGEIGTRVLPRGCPSFS